MVNRQKRYLMASSPWMLWWPKMPELPQTLRLWEQQSPHAWSQKSPTPCCQKRSCYPPIEVKPAR